MQKRQKLKVVNLTTGKEYEDANKLNILRRANCLVLNADYRPVSFLPLSVENWQDSITKVFQRKVTIVENYPFVARSPTTEIQVPAVVARREYQERKRRVQFSRANVFLRDGHKCQYCGNNFTSSNLTYDHLVPRSMGGKTNFGNIVTSCEKCNSAKKNRPMSQWTSPLGLNRPLNLPFEPSHFLLEDRIKDKPIIIPSASWAPYLDWRGSIWVHDPETNKNIQIQGLEEDVGDENSGIYTTQGPSETH